MPFIAMTELNQSLSIMLLRRNRHFRTAWSKRKKEWRDLSQGGVKKGHRDQELSATVVYEPASSIPNSLTVKGSSY